MDLLEENTLIEEIRRCRGATECLYCSCNTENCKCCGPFEKFVRDKRWDDLAYSYYINARIDLEDEVFEEGSDKYFHCLNVVSIYEEN